MFIDMKLKPVIRDGCFEGVYIHWVFDMVFTGNVLMDNGIGWKEELNDEDIVIIRDTSFINLVNYNYFTFFNIDGKISPAETFTDFSAFMTENRLGYEFFLPVNSPEPVKLRDDGMIRVAVYDESFFCDIAYMEEDPIEMDSDNSTAVSWELSENKDAPIFYDNSTQLVSREGAVYTGQTFPTELILENAGR